MSNFVEKALRGEYPDPAAELDRLVGEWHDGKPALHEWLGFTWEEYARWVEHPSELQAILADRRAGRKPIDDEFPLHKVTKVAWNGARPGVTLLDEDEEPFAEMSDKLIERLLEWAIERGRISRVTLVPDEARKLLSMANHVHATTDCVEPMRTQALRHLHTACTAFEAWLDGGVVSEDD